MLRPSWPEYFMRAAYLIATRATCDRKHVGAVIVTPENRVVASGYNGSPRNTPSCDEAGHELHQNHCVRTLHAESNALDFAGQAASGCTLYVTVIPCYDCAKRVVNAGIKKVVYDQFYASRYGKSDQVSEFFRVNGIECVQYDSPGLTLFKVLLEQMANVEKEALRVTRVPFVCGCEVDGLSAGAMCLVHEQPRSDQ